MQRASEKFKGILKDYLANSIGLPPKNISIVDGIDSLEKTICDFLDWQQDKINERLKICDHDIDLLSSEINKLKQTSKEAKKEAQEEECLIECRRLLTPNLITDEFVFSGKYTNAIYTLDGAGIFHTWNHFEECYCNTYANTPPLNFFKKAYNKAFNIK